MKYGTTDAINFLLGIGTDQKGRTVHDYYTFTPEKWEECHDHIQWAFPTDIPSQFNDNAPVISIDAIEMGLFNGLNSKQMETIHTNITTLYMKYFSSIGFDPKLFPGQYVSDNDIRTPDNHNFRRLSRVMRSMAIMKLLFSHSDDFENGLEFSNLIPDPEQIRDYLFTNFVPQCDLFALSPDTLYFWYTSATDILRRVNEVQYDRSE